MSERRIKLTDQQAKDLRGDLMSSKALSKVLTQLLLDATEELTAKSDMAWIQIRRLADAKESDEVTVEWVTQEIVVRNDEPDVE